MTSWTNNTSDGAGYLAGASSNRQRNQTSHPRQTYTFINYQAAVTDANKSKSSPLSAKNGNKIVAEPRSHPTMRLSHIQHDTSANMNSQQIEIHMTSAKKLKYHEAVSRKTQENFDRELEKSFAVPLKSREGAQPAPPKTSGRVSLAATHPAKYATFYEPLTPVSMQPDNRQSKSPEQSLSSPPKGSSLPPTQLPWRKDTADPMWQTSSDPHYWTRNRTVLKADASVEYGNVVSPTWMIGLPFGCGMTELAEAYPAQEDCDDRMG